MSAIILNKYQDKNDQLNEEKKEMQRQYNEKQKAIDMYKGTCSYVRKNHQNITYNWCIKKGVDQDVMNMLIYFLIKEQHLNSKFVEIVQLLDDNKKFPKRAKKIAVFGYNFYNALFFSPQLDNDKFKKLLKIINKNGYDIFDVNDKGENAFTALQASTNLQIKRIGAQNIYQVKLTDEEDKMSVISFIKNFKNQTNVLNLPDIQKNINLIMENYSHRYRLLSTSLTTDQIIKTVNNIFLKVNITNINSWVRKLQFVFYLNPNEVIKKFAYLITTRRLNPKRNVIDANTDLYIKLFIQMASSPNNVQDYLTPFFDNNQTNIPNLQKAISLLWSDIQNIVFTTQSKNNYTFNLESSAITIARFTKYGYLTNEFEYYIKNILNLINKVNTDSIPNEFKSIENSTLIWMALRAILHAKICSQFVVHSLELIKLNSTDSAVKELISALIK